MVKKVKNVLRLVFCVPVRHTPFPAFPHGGRSKIVFGFPPGQTGKGKKRREKEYTNYIY
jgi:hypothetical protein